MQIRYLLALCLLSHYALADEPCSISKSECTITPPVTPYIASQKQIKNPETITISAKSSEATIDQATFKGDVTFTQGLRRIKANDAVLNQKSEQLNANGNLVLQDKIFTITAASLVAQMKENNATLQDTQYWLNGKQIHGNAKTLTVNKDNDLFLTDSSLTTCPIGRETWALEANEIKIDSSEEWGEIWGAKLRLFDIPVFYIPYITVPVSDKRKTGFLYPSFGSNTTNGFELTTPFYWNISPKYDFTLTPTLMSNRGVFLQSEFRYLLGEAQSGQMNVEYMGDDNLAPNKSSQYLYHWQHSGSINDNWRVDANFTDVSDPNYLYDLPSMMGATNQLVRYGQLSYLETNWDASLRFQNIKLLFGTGEPYEVKPQFNFNYYAPAFWHNLGFTLNTEISEFAAVQEKAGMPNNVTRFHIEPTLTLPWVRPAGSIVTEVKLYQTNYNQRDIVPIQTTSPQLEENVNRTIPQFKIYGQMNFERQFSLFNQQYQQTFEPKVQYLYVGYEDQSHIGIYDSAFLQDNYYGLFRDKRYSGLDRIANANQFTLGVTNRFLDPSNEEIFRFSIGQIFFLENNRVPINNFAMAATQPSFSVLAAEMDAKLYQHFYVGGAMQYDAKQSQVNKSEVSFDYRPAANKLIQLNYRYIPDLLENDPSNIQTISQSGVRTAWPLSDNVYFEGNWYYDINNHRQVETYAGLKYESCCWAIQFGYHSRIEPNYQNYNDPIKDEGFFLNFMLKGLGGSGVIGVKSGANDNVFGYRKPIYLTD